MSRGIPLALTANECGAVIDIGAGLPPSIAGPESPAEALIDVPATIRHKLQTAVLAANEALWQLDIGSGWSFELKRYRPGQGHPLHVDLIAGASVPKLGMSVQLSPSTGYEGGDLVLHPGQPAPRARGSVVVYPSFVPHEVRAVTSGERWALVVWCWGPAFR
jgi:predicted 2-oxoglutarate/Fe(II)-dependent dioxygenase YbiX